MPIQPMPFEASTKSPIIVGSREPCPMLACATRTDPGAHSRNHLCEYVGRNPFVYADEWRCVCGHSAYANTDESRARRGVSA